MQTLPIRSAISPIARPDASLYSAQTIARGQALAKLGACFTCHTVEDGIPLAGGRAIETPFGNVFSTNITPDVATGIGGWSFEAFARAAVQKCVLWSRAPGFFRVPLLPPHGAGTLAASKARTSHAT